MSLEYKIGEYLISTLHEHPSAQKNPREIWPDVPQKSWDPFRKFALLENGMVQSIWRGHLIRKATGEGQNVLVDTGMGPGPHDHTGKSGELIKSIEKIGLDPEQIDAVVITHCHGDHIGWNVTWDGDSPKATFPNAKYYVAADDWDFYSSLETKIEAFEKSIRPLEALGVLELVVGEREIVPGVRTLPTKGHTPGHQCVLVQSEGSTGVVTGDLFHNVAQITEQEWCPVFDWRTDLSTASRRWLLWRAQTEGWVIFSGHLATGKSIGLIIDKDGKPVWDPV